MHHKPILCPVVEIKIPQAKLKKEGSFLRQMLDDSHVVKQTPAKRVQYGSRPKMGRE